MKVPSERPNSVPSVTDCIPQGSQGMRAKNGMWGGGAYIVFGARCACAAAIGVGFFTGLKARKTQR